MRNLTKIQLVLCTAVMMLIGVSQQAFAFDASRYATNSKLSSGKWVKITIPETGVYELTDAELRSMGFSNPANVRLYGHGGYRISEILNGRAIDDLNPVPVMRYPGKICFYGNGPIRYTLSNYTSVPRFTREFNPYSQVGCYFLTEESSSEVHMANKPVVSVSSFVDKPVSLDFFYHEKELSSISNSGKEMVGEEFANVPLLIDYYLPELADSTIVVNICLAANASDISYANAILHSGGVNDTTVYSLSSSRIYKPSNDMVFYNYASPFGKLKLTHPMERGQLEPLLVSSSTDFTAEIARLDYFILTYTRNNILPTGGDNQIRMSYAATNGNERFMLPGATPTTAVWCINDLYAPTVVPLSSYDDASGDGYCFYATATSHSDYVAFDPAKTLKKISAFEPIENQNLHGMATPDLLIITDKMFLDQAERVADMHRSIDGLDVIVADQQQVFNEFSSGTRDAMAYRLFSKMLFDRDNTKLKSLLLFGPGTLDNREALGEHPGNLLTYQSDNSNYEDFTYTTDDFFGFLEDNSGGNLSSERLSVGVGRINSEDPAEARSDVDKLIEYYATPDYGVWRNNTCVSSDSPDDGVYMFQAEGYKNQIDNDLNTGMHVTSVHNSQYPRSTLQPNSPMDRKDATVAKQLLTELFKSGVYFMTYVGHAGSIGLTKYNNLWITTDVFNTDLTHLPIVSTACCNVAHFDADTRGIAEQMFHYRNGGAIALLTTSRMVFAAGNDQINTYFIDAMFSRENGNTLTLGEAVRRSKLAFPSANTNKLNFFLLGDPAMKINFPESRFNIMSVNNTDMTDTINAQISPLQRFDIVAHVMDKNGNLDSGFNGDATVTLYDKQELFTSLAFTVTVSNERVTRDIYFNRAKLAEITGRVVNGVFHGQMIAPKAPNASNEDVLLRVYAHQDNSSVMVNGLTTQITMLPYDDDLAINDQQSPVITSMFINDEETFVNGAVVAPDAVLYITATDDQGINLQANSVEGGMTLLLDAGRPSYSDVSCYATAGENGKSVYVEYPLKDLVEGEHTLTYTVYDLLGNSTTHTITFMVGQNSIANLVADKLPAYLDGDVNFDLDTYLARTPEFTLRVTDATGKLVWKTNASSFPVNWDMRDMNGQKVKAGLYRYYGTYNDGINYGGTAINKLIVLDPLKVKQ